MLKDVENEDDEDRHDSKRRVDSQGDWRILAFMLTEGRENEK